MKYKITHFTTSLSDLRPFMVKNPPFRASKLGEIIFFHSFVRKRPKVRKTFKKWSRKGPDLVWKLWILPLFMGEICDQPQPRPLQLLFPSLLLHVALGQVRASQFLSENSYKFGSGDVPKLVGEAWQNYFEVSSMWIIVEIQYKLEYFYDKKSITKSGRVSLMWIIQLNCLDPVQTWIDCILCTVVLSHVIIQGFFSITLATYHTCTLFCVVCPTLVHEYSSLYWI